MRCARGSFVARRAGSASIAKTRWMPSRHARVGTVAARARACDVLQRECSKDTAGAPRLTFYYNSGKIVYAVFFPEFCACKASKFSYD